MSNPHRDDKRESATSGSGSLHQCVVRPRLISTERESSLLLDESPLSPTPTTPPPLGTVKLRIRAPPELLRSSDANELSFPPPPLPLPMASFGDRQRIRGEMERELFCFPSKEASSAMKSDRFNLSPSSSTASSSRSPESDTLSPSEPVPSAEGHSQPQFLLWQVAVLNGDLSQVEEFIRKGIDVDQATSSGSSALLIAASKGYAEICRRLIQAGSDVNQRSRRGTCPLLAAVSHSHVEVVELLLKAGANVNSTDHYGKSALLYATSSGCLPVIPLLLAAGADFELADKAGHSALSLAVSAANVEMTACLLGLGAKPSSVVPANVILSPRRQNQRNPAADLLQKANQWTPESHNLFPPAFRERIKLLMKVHRRLEATCAVAPPYDIWVRILSYAGRDDWGTR